MDIVCHLIGHEENTGPLLCYFVRDAKPESNYEETLDKLKLREAYKMALYI